VSQPGLGTTHNRFFAAWARFVIRNRYAVLLLTLVTTGVLGHQAATHLTIDTSNDTFVDRDSEPGRILRELREDFGVDGVTLIVIEGEVFSEPFLKKLRALHDALATLDVESVSVGEPSGDATPAAGAGTADDFSGFGDDEGWGDEQGGTVIDEISSMINVRQTRWVDGGMSVGGLLDTWPSAAELPALQKRVLADATLVGRVVNPSGTYTSITLRTAMMSHEDTVRVQGEIDRVVREHDAPGFRALLGGAPAQEAAINGLIQTDLARLAIAGLLLMLFIMTMTFHHPIGIVGPILVVIQAVTWTFGLMGATGSAMTMLSNILPMFITCVGIGDSVHIQSVYRDGRGRGLDNETAIVNAVATTGTAVLFTTLTTCAGLLSFRMASMDAIRQMGTFGALGVATALILSLVFLPAVLTFNRKSHLGLRRREGSDRLDALLRWCNSTSAPTLVGGHTRMRGRNVTIGIALSFTAIAVVGGSQLRIAHDPVAWIPDHFDIKRAFVALDEEMGGSADLSLLIDAPEGGSLRDRELILGLEKLEAHIKAYDHPSDPHLVGQIASVLDVIRETNRATHENDEAYYRLPETERGIGDMLTMFENAGPKQLRRLATVDLARSVMIVRVRWKEASGYHHLVQHIEQGVEKHLGPQYTVHPSGSVYSMYTFIGALVSVLLQSFGLALLIITIMMVVILRDLRLGILSMVPNVLPVGVVIGIMGFFGVPVDLNTLLLAPIALGIAVDDSIHFLHQFRVHRDRHGDVEAAIDHTFAYSGRAIVTTSVILTSGFFIFCFAQMSNLIYFGLLVALTLLLAVIVDLIFTPALLRAVYGRARTRGAEEVSTSAQEALS